MSEMTSFVFENLKITPVLKRSLRDRFKYNNMTEVQGRSIHIELKGCDVLIREC